MSFEDAVKLLREGTYQVRGLTPLPEFPVTARVYTVKCVDIRLNNGKLLMLDAFSADAQIMVVEQMLTQMHNAQCEPSTHLPLSSECGWRIRYDG